MRRCRSRKVENQRFEIAPGGPKSSGPRKGCGLCLSALALPARALASTSASAASVLIPRGAAGAEPPHPGFLELKVLTLSAAHPAAGRDRLAR